jgi:hypothetical protein
MAGRQTCRLLHVVLLPLLDIVLVRVIHHLLLIICKPRAGEACPAEERGRQLPRHQLLRDERAGVLAAVAVAPPAEHIAHKSPHPTASNGELSALLGNHAPVPKDAWHTSTNSLYRTLVIRRLGALRHVHIEKKKSLRVEGADLSESVHVLGSDVSQCPAKPGASLGM